MSIKKFSQEEVSRIVALRLKRERERLNKEFENKMKRCIASVHLILHQEMRATEPGMTDKDQESLFQAAETAHRSITPGPEQPVKMNYKGGEQK